MDQDIQIINGKFYTKPPEPVEIPRETIEGMLAASQNDLASTQAMRENLISAQDARIVECNTQITTLEALLSQVGV